MYRIQKSIRLYVADYLQSYMLNLKKLPGEKEIRIARSVPLARLQPWPLQSRLEAFVGLLCCVGMGLMRMVVIVRRRFGRRGRPRPRPRHERLL